MGVLAMRFAGCVEARTGALRRAHGVKGPQIARRNAPVLACASFFVLHKNIKYYGIDSYICSCDGG